MKKFILPITIFIFAHYSIFSQDKVEYTPSNEVFEKAYNEIENEELIDAIGTLENIHRNDTSYQDAQKIILACNIDLENYDKVIELCDFHINNKTFDENHDLYTYKAEALLNNEEYDATQKMLDEALTEYPNSASIHYYKAEGYRKEKKYDDAVYEFQQAIKFNPYKQLYHFKLGMIYADADQPTRANLALNFSIIINSTSKIGFATLQFLDEFGKGNYSPEEEIKLTKESSDYYAELDLIFKNGVALDSKYKLKNKLIFNVTKQNQLLLENLKFDEEDLDFCNQNYARFFTSLQKRGYFNEMCYHQFKDLNSPKVQKIISKNESKTNAFLDWARTELDKTFYYRLFDKNGKGVPTKSLYGGNFGIEATGEMNDFFKQVGKWIYFNDFGKKTLEVNYSDQSKKEGLTRGYYDNGELYYEVNYEGGEINGEKKVYYDNGSRKINVNVVDGLNDGTYKEYYPTDVIHYETKTEKGREVEYYNIYHANGQLRDKMLISNGKIDGDYIAYHPNGKESEVATFSNGDRNGKSTSYYESGKIQNEGTYVTGSKDGAWKFYYENGQVESEGSYKKGTAIGEWKKYHLNGSIKEIADYGTSGNKTGIVKTFNSEGKLIQELTYKGEDIVAYNFRDNNETILTEGEIEKKELNITGKFPNGNMQVEGTYTKSERTGKWKFYDANGVLSSVENYNQEGQLDGKLTNYFGDGNIETVTRYKEGERDGYYEDYYFDGSLFEQGNFCEGERCGLWVRYFKNGQISKETYYLDGSPVGFQTYYDEKGRVYEQYSYEDGYYKEFIRFDTLGKEINHIYFNKEEQKSSIPNVIGGKYMESTYKGSMLNGPVKWYASGADLKTEGHFINDQRDGLFKFYDLNGKLKREINYSYGDRHGIEKGYFANGKLEYEGNYYYGDKTGEWTFYNEDGTIYSKNEYLNGSKHGKSIYYASGEIAYIKYYYEGSMYAYSYSDKSGNEIEPIMLKNGSGDMLCYFKNGQKSYELKYDNGVAQGGFKRWYPNGKLYKEGNYKDDYLYGVFKEYASNGKVIEEENYDKDELNGKAVYYYPSGKKKSEFNYFYGQKYGTGTYYNENGTIKSQFIFYSNNAIKKVK